MLRRAGRFAGKVTFVLSKAVIKTGWKAGQITARTGMTTGKFVARKGLNTGKHIINKANPINKRINKSDIADHGVESLRLANTAYKTGKQTIKTTKTTIKTTEKSIKLAGETAKNTKRTVVTTYRVVKATVIFIKDFTIALVTVATSPALWIVVAASVIIAVLISAAATLLGGASEYEEQVRQATNDPVALAEDMPEDIQDALGYFQTACDNQRNEYCGKINGLYYNINDLKNSDLVYMRRNNPPAEFQKSYATDGKKTQLCEAWDVKIIAPEALAIVYVLLERAENEANGTEMDLYPIEYTQEAFDDLLDMCCETTEDVYERQECLTLDCSEEYEETPNPAYTIASTEYNTAVNRYNDFLFNVAPYSEEYRSRLEAYYAANNNARSAMADWVTGAYAMLVQAFQNWESVFGVTGWEINEYMDINCMAWLGDFVESAYATLQSTPETIRTPRPVCEHLHDLHSLGLNFFNAEETMARYSFTDAELQWAENLTQTYSAYFQYLEEEGGG